jgi:hypothetical protein
LIFKQVTDIYSGEKDMNREKLSTPIGDFEFVLDGYATKESAQKLFDALTAAKRHAQAQHQ